MRIQFPLPSTAERRLIFDGGGEIWKGIKEGAASFGDWGHKEAKVDERSRGVLNTLFSGLLGPESPQPEKKPEIKPDTPTDAPRPKTFRERQRENRDRIIDSDVGKLMAECGIENKTFEWGVGGQIRELDQSHRLEQWVPFQKYLKDWLLENATADPSLPDAKYHPKISAEKVDIPKLFNDFLAQRYLAGGED